MLVTCALLCIAIIACFCCPQSHPDLSTLKTTHFQFLLDSGQEERAGRVKEAEGDLATAVTLYMKAGLPGKAAKLISQHQVSSDNGYLQYHQKNVLLVQPAQLE